MGSMKTIAVLRFATAFAMIFSIIWQITDRLAHNLFRPAEYFSYFTIQTGMIAAVTLSIGGWFAWQGRKETHLLNLVRLSSITMTVVVTIVYNALLRNLPNLPEDGNYQWPVPPNEILHVWAGIILVIDWMLSSRRVNLRLRSIFWTLAFPLAWLAYSVIRGLAINWWPYWFINPNESGGVSGMLEYIFGIMIFLLVVASALIGLQRLTVRVFRR
jgi:hypothetical protein